MSTIQGKLHTAIQRNAGTIANLAHRVATELAASDRDNQPTLPFTTKES
ncbi:hypothetical protein OHR86_12830 [Streptomyces sp. NBC_00441]|nr:hypothetical protein [Streptomyces sp. NBC_00441]